MKRFPKLRKFLLRAILLLIILIPVGWAFENWRGARAWEEAQTRAKVAGVSLVRSDYAGTEIPDGENLLENEVFLKEFENEGEDRLDGWDQLPVVTQKWGRLRMDPATGETFPYSDYFKEELSEENARKRLAEAAEDFEIRLDALSKVIGATPVHTIFARSASECPLGEIAGELGAVSNLSGCLKSSAMMALRSGKSAKALDRMRVLDRWGRTIGTPSLVHYLMGNATRRQNLTLVWEGIRLRAWSDEELDDLGKLLMEWNTHTGVVSAFKFEAAFGVESQEGSGAIEEHTQDSGESLTPTELIGKWWQSGGPAGWKAQRKALLVNKYLDFIEEVEEGNLGISEKMKAGLSVVSWSPLREAASQIDYLMKALFQVYHRAETQRRIALIAIASERYFLVHQAYPKELSDLNIDTPVIDLTDPNGRELVYELGPEGRPVIFSRHEEETTEKAPKWQLRWQFYQGR